MDQGVGGQPDQLAAHQSALLDRVKRGDYVNIDQAIANLQAIGEGRVPDPAAIRAEIAYPPFRRFRLGGVGKQDLLKRGRGAATHINDLARDVMIRVAFTTQENAEEVDTIVLTPADFGYAAMPSMDEMFDTRRLADWSARNAHLLPEGRTVDLLPAEAGPHIREQYLEQPAGEDLYVAMDRFRDLDDDPSIFLLAERNGQLLLRTFWMGYQNIHVRKMWHPRIPILFRLR